MAYELLKHAAAFARQLEQAGLPEGSHDHSYEITFGDGATAVAVQVFDHGGVQFFVGNKLLPLSRVGDPLPETLVAAIQATEGANG